jgi:hypothetical protein
MPFGLVEFHDLLDLQVKRPVDVFQPLRKIFMHSRLGNPKFFAAERTVALLSMM